MQRVQRTTLLILALLGALYFAFFFIPNASTLGSDNPLVYLDRDEYVTYPVVERMLAFEGDIHQIWGSLIIYGDYHYGYPFYFVSMLVLLPFRLIQGADFFNHIPFNILMLRQFINVLPMVLAAGVLTYVQTHFKSAWKSVLTFVLLLTIPAVVRSNIHWWHPDSLTLLAIALTFFYLDLDEFRLGKFFYFAAAACGLASAIKLMGFFFFLAIPVYLLIAWKKKGVALKRVISSAVIFLLVMCAVIVCTNPFLFYQSPREEMLATQSLKTEELSGGYEHEESPYYAKGPQYWRWTLKVSYDLSFMVRFPQARPLLAAAARAAFFYDHQPDIPIGKSQPITQALAARSINHRRSAFTRIHCHAVALSLSEKHPIDCCDSCAVEWRHLTFFIQRGNIRTPTR